MPSCALHCALHTALKLPWVHYVFLSSASLYFSALPTVFLCSMPACLGRCTLQRERWYVIVDRAAQLLTAAELHCRQGGRRSGAAARNVGTERAPLAAAAAAGPALQPMPDQTPFVNGRWRCTRMQNASNQKLFCEMLFIRLKKNLQPMADQTLWKQQIEFHNNEKHQDTVIAH